MKFTSAFYFCCFITSISFSQQKEKLIATWYLKDINYEEKQLVLDKKEKSDGYIFIIQQNSIQEVFFEQCISDMRFYESLKKGKGTWDFNEQSTVFSSSIPLTRNRFTKFKLEFITDNRIKLIAIN